MLESWLRGCSLASSSWAIRLLLPSRPPSPIRPKVIWGWRGRRFIGTYDPQQTCSDQRGDGHPDMAWQRGPVDHSGFINTGTLTVNPGKDPPQAPIQNIRCPTACEGQSAIKGTRFHGLRQRDWRPPTPLRAINFTLSWQAEGPVAELP